VKANSTAIRFGTDGWRSRMDTDFNLENVGRVAKAIADHLLSVKGHGKVFIGYDGRANSRDFAAACAEVLATAGFQCFLPPRPVPTPITAFTAVKFSLSGAVMITASHNPAVYNGIKFIPDYGGPATTDITQSIEALVRPDPPEHEPFQSLWQRGEISELDPIEPYIDHVLRLLELKIFDVDVVVDPMHGASSGIMESLLKHLGARVHVVRGGIDPLFGGFIPDPVPSNLAELRDATLGSGSSMGIATDGDGDRVAAVTEKGTFLLANQLLPLIYFHLLERRSMKGDVARTVATSHLVDRVATGYGMKSIEVPVGFKYIGSLLRERKVIAGGEESGGISLVTHIPEKDGIVSGLLAVESTILSGGSMEASMDAITSEYGTFISSRIDLQMEKPPSLSLGGLKFEVGQEILGGRIATINTMDGLKLILEDGSWLLFRASGTENVVRIYAESHSNQDTEALLALGRAALP
jgi:phosphomannomutase